MEGWIKIHRKLLDWEWLDDMKTFKLFMYLLLTVNYEDKKWQGVEVKAGQKITSVANLASATRLTSQNVRTSLNRLKSTNELTIKTTNRFTIITVCKWSEYQLEETSQLTNKLTNAQQTTNKQLTTTKEVKKERINTVDQNFEKFWITYPNKIGKKKALGVWKKLTTKEKQLAINALPSHISSNQWKTENGRFIPHPTTWLNRGGWEDEVTTKQSYGLKKL
jgi:hypothetical protein|tara:strand:- start:19093 stop:19755 length:663 start_codon:yes stop_codon:yes gene_type:complete